MAEANRAIRQLPEAVKLATQQVAEVTAFQYVQAVKPEIPIGSGIHRWQDVTHIMHLRNAVTWKRRGNGAVVGVDVDAFYWKYLEWGTKFIQAMGMFRRTADRLRGDHRSRLLQALQAANRQALR